MNAEVYCRINDSYTEAYLGRDKALRLRRCGGFSFDLPAFIFSFFHFYRKKMYKEFIILLAAAVIIPIIIGAAAGISSMEGDITFSSVYHELRQLPLKYTFTPTAGGGIIPGGIKAYHEHEPAFRFWLARLAGTLAVSLFCGLSFDRLQKRRTEKDIARQLSQIKTSDADVQKSVLQKAGRENSRPAPYRALVFLLWAAVLLSHFYHAVYLPPKFFEWL